MDMNRSTFGPLVSTPLRSVFGWISAPFAYQSSFGHGGGEHVQHSEPSSPVPVLSLPPRQRRRQVSCRLINDIREDSDPLCRSLRSTPMFTDLHPSIGSPSKLSLWSWRRWSNPPSPTRKPIIWHAYRIDWGTWCWIFRNSGQQSPSTHLKSRIISLRQSGLQTFRDRHGSLTLRQCIFVRICWI